SIRTDVAVGRGTVGVRHPLGVRHLKHPDWCGCGAWRGWCQTLLGCLTAAASGLMWLWGVGWLVSDTLWVSDTWRIWADAAMGRGPWCQATLPACLPARGRLGRRYRSSAALSGTLSRTCGARRKSKSTPWSAWVTDCR